VFGANVSALVRTTPALMLGGLISGCWLARRTVVAGVSTAVRRVERSCEGWNERSVRCWVLREHALCVFQWSATCRGWTTWSCSGRRSQLSG